MGDERGIGKRGLLLGTMAAMLPPAVRAAALCGTAGPAGQACRVYVQNPNVIRQQCPEWCWAASASMIFAMHGHPVDQKRIVAGVFGALACAASQNLTIAQILSTTWIDDNGDPFQSDIQAAYDFGNGVDAITTQFIIDELANDRPLLYGNDHHAMVLSQVDFVDRPNGPDVQAIGVFDPWPLNPPFHPLSQPEMIPAHLGGQLNFLAAVQVS